jgi:hypothetical protein
MHSLTFILMMLSRRDITLINQPPLPILQQFYRAVEIVPEAKNFNVFFTDTVFQCGEIESTGCFDSDTRGMTLDYNVVEPEQLHLPLESSSMEFLTLHEIARTLGITDNRPWLGFNQADLFALLAINGNLQIW